MAQFEVSTSKLNDEAAQLDNLKNQLEQKIQQMASISARYLNMWEGESKQAFNDSVIKNMNLLRAFTNNMQKFSAALRQGASTYETAENNAKRIASQKGQ
jgi:WXG100 family type VII secretion target